MWMTSNWLERNNIDPMWKGLNKEVDLGEPTSFLDHVYLVCTQRQCEISKDILLTTITAPCLNPEFLQEQLKKWPCSENLRISSWSHDMESQEMCGTTLWVGEQNDSTTQQSIKSIHWRPSFQRRRIEICGRIVKSMLLNCSECLYLARIGRPDIPWSVNKLARSITKWTKACDKRLSRLISYIQHTCEYKQYGHVGNIARQCRLGLFQDSDFAGDLEDSKSTSCGTLCVFGSHTFVPISWMCQKQTSVSHSSTESEIIFLIYGIWSTQFLETRIRVIKNGETR